MATSPHEALRSPLWGGLEVDLGTGSEDSPLRSLGRP